jgi:hypothetical protein
MPVARKLWQPMRSLRSQNDAGAALDHLVGIYAVLQETAGGVLAGVGDERRHHQIGRGRCGGSGRSGDGQLVGPVGGLVRHGVNLT